MKQFEYYWVTLRSFSRCDDIGSLIPGTSFKGWTERLVSLGLEGWELCGFEYGCAWFKKEIG